MSTVAAAQPKAKKTAASKKPPSHPPFAEMITDAVASLKERTGSSQYAITKFIEEKHKDLPPSFRKLILNYLKKSVAAGKLIKVKNSFKLPSTKPAPAKATTTVPATKKPKAVSKPNAKPKPKPKAAAVSVKPKAKPTKVTAAKKKVAAKPARKTPVKAVKKPKSVKSPAKKAKKDKK
ncbi:histone H1-like [Gastrolobium bilobum]|uniref:histone H1-like n=1 Tax=Gastrolobium bilobum TaxID=150636 RepID=UPI002AB08C65|nr:histone H1-like [Gastrolobium bilobum]